MSRKLNTIYVGGIDDSVTEEILHAAFIPFGELKSIQIPKDYQQSICFQFYLITMLWYNIGEFLYYIIIILDKNRGFAFVEYDLEEDASDAIDNMDGSELFGKVLRCNIAKAMPKLAPGKAIWSAEEWIQKSLKDGDHYIDDDEVLVEPR